MSDRVILHCDCNSFFASVETVIEPRYKNVPMAVCGSESDRHGIVLAKNELAKQFGIKTAETVFSARKKCKNLVIASPHYEEYVMFSKRVNEIYSRYTDMIEPFGIDESWLDVSASRRLFGSGMEIAERIRKEVREELGITVSIGVSFNKIFAKLGSDYKKPDAITEINRENYKNIVYPLPVGQLLFVGKKTEKLLDKLRIRTIGELAQTPKPLLTMRLGKFGEALLKYAKGDDDSPVNPHREDAKSISNGFTFKHDLVSRSECRAGIDFLAEEVGLKLRNSGFKCRTVGLTIKDDLLHSVQRQRPQNPPTDLSREIAETAYEILLDEWEDNKPIRMITVSALNLVKEGATQISLFEENKNELHQKSQKREYALDKIRQKYGNESILNAGILNNDLGFYSPNGDKDRD